jgi:hypothetical protein
MTITYAIEHHDITSLTAPMWDACGIECPAMIGAECPGGMKCHAWSSKFPNAATEVVYGWSLSSFQDEETGSTDSGPGWFALFRTPDDELTPNNAMGAGVILCTVSSGAVSLTRFDSVDAMNQEWAKILADTADNNTEES